MAATATPRALLRPLLLCAAAALARAGNFLEKEEVYVEAPSEAISAVAEEPGCGWPEGLKDKGYADGTFVGAGASACVYLSTNSDGVEVAVKVSKKQGDKKNFYAFVNECRGMHLLRLEACKKGEEMVDLQEAFLPNCLDSGEVDDTPYIIMHKAPKDPIGRVGHDFNLDVAQQKAVFAQLIASIYALHGVERAHNDLHGNNIVLDSTASKPPLALIDFGEVSPMAKAMKTGYKRDGNAIWRWTAEIASCAGDAKWQDTTGKMQDAKDAFLNCLEQNWQTDSDFKKAMELLVDADINKMEDQQVAAVYETKFVKDNLPALQKKYTLGTTEGCTSWESSQFDDIENKFFFSAHYKCESIPTWDDSDTVCAKSPQTGACFTLKPGVHWGCGSGLDPKIVCISVGLPGGVPGKYDGACLKHDHPAYKYAMDFADDPIMPDPDPETTTTEEPEATTTTQEEPGETTTTEEGPGETTTTQEEPEETTTTEAVDGNVTTTTEEPDDDTESEGGSPLLMFIKVSAVVLGLGLCFFLYKQSLQARAPVVANPGVELQER